MSETLTRIGSSAWAEIDALKLEQRARTVVKDQAREDYRRSRAQRAARRNVERWFRELPPDLVLGGFTLHPEALPTGVTTAGIIEVANDWLLSRGLGPTTPRPLRPPSERELALIRALKACRFPPASFAKRFAREISETAITDGQAAQVRRLVSRFRRQIRAVDIHKSDRHLLNKVRR